MDTVAVGAIMTLVVNIFGGPGSGKSTFASALYDLFKVMDYDVELALEFAKDLVMEGRLDALKMQPYVFGEQYLRIKRLEGKATVVITDSPLLLSAIYGKDLPPSFAKSVIDLSAKFNNYNIFICRGDQEYRRFGRIHTEAEARAIDNEIWDLLVAHTVFTLASNTSMSCSYVMGDILKRLGCGGQIHRGEVPAVPETAPSGRA